MSNMYIIFLAIFASSTLADRGDNRHVKLRRPTNPEPPTTKTTVDVLAHAITYGLTHSNVLGRSAHFKVRRPHDMFFRVGTKLLEKANIYDPDLAEVAAHAVETVGVVTSRLYFDTVGYEMAKFLDLNEMLTDETAVYFAFMVVAAIERDACTHGVYDAESVTTAVVYGLFDVMYSLGLTNYENMVQLFHFFADEILRQSGH